MTYQVVIHPEAEAEIDEAFSYIYRDAPRNAQRWLKGLYKAIDSLEMFPQRCGLARESAHFPVELRQYIYKSHRVIFTIEGDTVRVLHVRHAARLPFTEEDKARPEEDDEEKEP